MMNQIVLEDNKEYIIADIININNIKYVYLGNKANSKDVCVRKLDSQDKFLIGLDSKEEVALALNAYFNKYKDIFAS